MGDSSGSIGVWTVTGPPKEKEGQEEFLRTKMEISSPGSKGGEWSPFRK